MRNFAYLTLLFISPIFADSSKYSLREILQLPFLMDKRYGDEKITINDRAELNKIRPQKAAQLMDRLLSDPRNKFALNRKTLLSVPTDPQRNKNPRERIRNFGIQKLLGAKPADKWMSYWWELRLNTADRPAKVAPTKGVRVLMATQTFPKVKSLANGMSFGHASLGTVVLGATSVKKDIFMNPGSNPPKGFKPTIKSSFLGVEGINNHIESSNFWDFIETQTEIRKVGFTVNVLPLTPLQNKVLEDLLDDAHGIDYGKFKMPSNNCSHGARDVFNSLLRLDNEIDMTQLDLSLLKPQSLFSEILAFTVTPHKVVRGAIESFGVIGNFTVPSSEVPKGYKVPPGFYVTEYPNKKATNAYRAYEAWLKEKGFN